MSHFTLLVTKINETGLDYQLEPFYEGLPVEPYISRTKAQIIESEKDDLARYNRCLAGRNDCHESSLKYLEKKFGGKTYLTESELYEGFVKEFQGDDTAWVDDFGNLVLTFNPNAKYDWYVIGGRWSGYFAKKPDMNGMLGMPGVFGNEPRDDYVDIIRAGDIDWKRMELDDIAENSEYFDEQMALPENERFRFDRIYKDGMTKEEYVNKNIPKTTFAVLHDGVWYERGQMGWFASVQDEKPAEDWEACFNNIINL